MGFISWLILGLIAGFIASKIINKSGEGLIMDIVLGVVGALVGGFIVSKVPMLSNLFGQGGVNGLNIPSMIIAVLGAILVLLIYHMVFRRRAV
jgi:uncharacterized membrane protein YeaQ/YmgE (transglycosylase-associated protein family)